MSARIAQASSRVSALMLMRSKKSQSAGKALILLWAAEPEIDSAVRTLGGRSSKPTILAISRNRARSAGLEVEHGYAMAVDAGVDVDDEIAARRLVGHCVHPVLGLALVELDAEAPGGFHHPGDGVRAFGDLALGRAARLGRLACGAWLHDGASFGRDGPASRST